MAAIAYFMRAACSAVSSTLSMYSALSSSHCGTKAGVTGLTTAELYMLGLTFMGGVDFSFSSNTLTIEGSGALYGWQRRAR